MIYGSAVSEEISTNGLGWNFYASITLDYSSLAGKTILSISLIMLGNDATLGSGVVATNVILASLAHDGNKISRIGAFAENMITVRAYILVQYTD